MMQPELTSGCLQVLLSGDKYDRNLVLQLLDKKRPVQNYRLLLSDGKMLTSFVTVDASLNDLAAELTVYTIIQVNEFEVLTFRSGRILKINNFKVLKVGEETNGKIGDPLILEALMHEQERAIMNFSPPLSD